MGWTQPRADTFNAYWDRDEDFEPSPPYELRPGVWMPGDDFGWIGETRKGIWTKRHPIAALAQEAPELHRVWSLWRAGVRELTPELLDRLTAPEVEAMLAMNAADIRRQQREMKQRGDPESAS